MRLCRVNYMKTVKVLKLCSVSHSHVTFKTEAASCRFEVKPSVLSVQTQRPLRLLAAVNLSLGPRHRPWSEAPASLPTTQLGGK